jgi:hypothetical protein
MGAAGRDVPVDTLPRVLPSPWPAAYRAGPVHRTCAAGGGAWFLQRSVVLLRDPSPRNAIRNVLASLVQLGLVLLGAIAEAAIHGRLVAF